MRLSVNLYGAPAMSLREISTYRQDLIVGASVQVSAPLGQYDTDRVVNIGTNRWAVKTEIGLSKAVGQWTLELMAAGAFFGNNDQYFPNRTREQQPIYSLQAAAIYAFRSGVWIAAASTYYTGGRTSIDGIEGDNLQKNSRVGIILTLPVNRYNSLKLYANTGVFTRTGSDFDSAGLAWQYRWGGGL